MSEIKSATERIAVVAPRGCGKTTLVSKLTTSNAVIVEDDRKQSEWPKSDQPVFWLAQFTQDVPHFETVDRLYLSTNMPKSALKRLQRREKLVIPTVDQPVQFSFYVFDRNDNREWKFVELVKA